MPPEDALGDEFRLGEAIVRPAAASIQIAGEERRVDRMAIRVLVHLAARAGEAVPRTDVLAAVWKQKYVGEEVLTVAVSTLRRALGDDARTPRFIETLPGYGYRVVASVDRTPRESKSAPPPDGRFWLAAAVGVTLAIGAFAGLVTDTIPRKDARAASVRPPPGGISPLTADPEAREAWIRGRALLEVGREEDLGRARRELAVVVERAPAFLPGRTALGEVWMRLAEQDLVAPGPALNAAEEAVRVVLERDADSAPALAVLGTVRFYRRDFAAAERQLAGALSIDPENALARSSYARYLAALGRFGAALEQLHRLEEIEPRSYLRPQVAKVLNMAGRPDLALAEIERQLELAPASYPLRVEGARAHFLLGEMPQAVGELLASLELCADPKWVEELRRAWEVGGEDLFFARNLQVLAEMEESGVPVTAVTWAQAAALAGDMDRAFDWLERAFERGEPGLVDLARDPLLAPIRADQRYWRLLHRVGIPS